MATYVTLKSKTKLGCNICDRCCINRGDIKITPVNVVEISRYMNISPREFVEKYTMRLENQPLEIVIKASGNDDRCILNNETDSRCQIHPVKPMQCVTFPLIPVDLKKDIFYKQDTCNCEEQNEMLVLDWLNGKNGIYIKYKKIYMEWIRFVEEIQSVWKDIDECTRGEAFDTLYFNYSEEDKDIIRSVKKNINSVKKAVRKSYR